MNLAGGGHLTYCSNIHAGEQWDEVSAALAAALPRIRHHLAHAGPMAIGLRLSAAAACSLEQPQALEQFRTFLGEGDYYVPTINGFPYGRFHGARVKEQVYAPDWTTRERLEYTKRLFDLLAELVPPGIEGSVSTVPCSFKDFIRDKQQVAAMRSNLWECVEHIAGLSERTGKSFHLGLEPEPLCYLETTAETVAFLETTGDRHTQVVGGLTALERRIREVAKAGATRAVVAAAPVDIVRPLPIPV